MVKAVSLLSGGLDSSLAVKLVQNQGITVEGVNFTTPFFSSENAKKAAKTLGIKLRVLDITDEHLEMLKNPKHGYGKNMNPCIDCHALMVKKAGRLMEEIGASFIVTGEVLRERPKSQNKQALWIVEKEGRYPHRVLRPLSAKLLPETQPEKERIVERDKLLAIEGRSRKEQMKLAKEFGIRDYPTPSGGCLLTDKIFSNRLKELLNEKKEIGAADVELIKHGRHFLVKGKGRVVVSRNKEENEVLLQLVRSGDMLFRVKDKPGPITILRGENGRMNEVIKRAAVLTARYSSARNLPEVLVAYRRFGKQGEEVIQIRDPLNSVKRDKGF